MQHIFIFKCKNGKLYHHKCEVFTKKTVKISKRDKQNKKLKLQASNIIEYIMKCFKNKKKKIIEYGGVRNPHL